MSQLLQAQLGSAFQFTPPGGGLFVWGQLTGQGPSGAETLQDASELARRAIDQGVAFVPGAPFYAHNPNSAALRLSFATVGLDKIQEGVGRLAKALLG